MKIFGVALIAFIILFLAGLFIYETMESGFSPLLLITLAPAAMIIAILFLLIKRLNTGVYMCFYHHRMYTSFTSLRRAVRRF